MTDTEKLNEAMRLLQECSAYLYGQHRSYQRAVGSEEWMYKGGSELYMKVSGFLEKKK